MYYSDEGLRVQSVAAAAGPGALAAVRPGFKAAAFAEFRQDWGTAGRVSQGCRRGFIGVSWGCHRGVAGVSQGVIEVSQGRHRGCAWVSYQ